MSPPIGDVTSTIDQVIPVVITYGQDLETHAQIVGNIMQPVGVPPDKSVTVTVFLTSAVPGTPIRYGLYDGGLVAAAAPPGQDMLAMVTLNQPVPEPPGQVLNVQPPALQFNFQAGTMLGMYRLLLTVPPKQYLLQFYAVRPRSTLPVPSPPPVETPPPNNTPPPQ
jgi:hypothetical protein